MDHTLRCNVLKCRREVNDHAVVTTCCHIFCIDCSNRCQLSGQRDGQRPVCPACDVQLTNPDDVVVANLKPTEDYKTSVLSGLNPNLIMECAGRALNFWAYQAMQEIVYQEYLAKNLTDKYSNLNLQMDKVVNDANSQISHLRNQMSGLQVDQENLRRKNDELSQALREKSRKLLQTQELYDKLKRRALLGQVQDAAHDAVDDTLQASTTADRFVDRVGAQNQYHTSHPIHQGAQSGGMQSPGPGLNTGQHMGPPQFNRGGNTERTWPGFSSQDAIPQNQPVQTPSTHRHRLGSGIAPGARTVLANIQSTGISRTPIPHPNISPSDRQALSSLNPNAATGPGFAGYGLTAGLKVSNPARSPANAVERPVIRSRVAQRTSSGFQSNSNQAFGPSPPGNMFSSRGNVYY
ncbi:RING-type E3 ubiquitin transferase CCNB1IP1 [Hyphodiscus hymeniophilus]|uniref:RING-type E3 ubiquitin transferase CCNB1IP1 n=1 Tax=Hyphodiscus hymeniophilus TaxID=353542 RepID=A0A9P6VSN9_9HELO|nr:RING-type E3 ubiquitin transferase CCNB1IP1 [Hyphodiscus hymeniophilus]